MKSLLLSLLILISCSDTSLRSPSNKGDLIQLLDKITVEVNKDIKSTKECFQSAKGYYEKFYSIEGKNINLSDFSKFEIETLVKNSFKIRLKIREKIQDLVITKDNYGEQCLAETRNITRALRYLEDYIIESFYKDNNSKLTTLEGQFPLLLVNPNYNFKSWKGLASGDVLLSRGSAYTSAAIARLGKTDAQFSHLTFVYRDDESKLHTTESHIEIGAVVNPFRVHLDQKNARTLVFRYKDMIKAHNASEHVYMKVRNHTEKKGKNIRYDFSMDYKNGDALFCSEVIYYGFKHAENIDVPKFKTSFNPKLKSFLKPLGVKEDLSKFAVFFPGDIEFDPRFELIAEWRNPKKLSNSRIKDAVLTKMFEWIEKDNYRFRPGTGNSTKAVAAWVFRKTPWLKKGFVERFPSYMKVAQLKLFMVLDQVGEVLQKKVEATQKAKGYLLSPKEMFETLEAFKKSDSKKKRQKSAFHKWFRR